MRPIHSILSLALAIAPTVALAHGAAAHTHHGAVAPMAPAAVNVAQRDLQTHFITVATEFQAARIETAGLLQMYALPGTTEDTELRSHAGALLTSAQRDLQVARTHLGHVRMMISDAGRLPATQSDLTAVSQGLAQTSAALDGVAQLSAANAAEMAQLRARAQLAVEQLGAAQGALGRIEQAMR